MRKAPYVHQSQGEDPPVVSWVVFSFPHIAGAESYSTVEYTRYLDDSLALGFLSGPLAVMADADPISALGIAIDAYWNNVGTK